MNSRVKKITLTAAILSISALSFAYADSATTTTQPGSVDDPVITKSYFEQNIQKQVAEELAKQTVNEEKIRQLVAAELARAGASSSGSNGNGSTVTTPPSSSSSTGSNSNMTIVKLGAGQILYGGEGTELIVRTGLTSVFSSDENGIPDVTIGKDIAAGAAVETNHLLIVPREGRGIKPAPKNNQEIFVMVRGNYLLVNADGSKATP
ncbi:hypothetical protein ACFQI7_29550 [Paenibacillus allorhizosphaerae]|uniref:Type IV pilus biogenesis protein PilP n=1 Tax=Paenibacillus allorhizosphaerae TaxID=2849866 RepID=A0ABM8VRM0_9BACL|nr:hypothetical protein [Paenibacillus allorhizosphaerae]CAG7655497.1 hypothetical protein PAECIP111802_06124 [Paenibacillus allorhizosphaerae]